MIYLTDAADPPTHSVNGGKDAYAGSDITMMCSLGRDGNPAVGKYSWYRESVLDGEDTSTNTRTVTLDNIKQDGKYSCEAFNLPHTGVWLGSGKSMETELFVRGEICLMFISIYVLLNPNISVIRVFSIHFISCSFKLIFQCPRQLHTR